MFKVNVTTSYVFLVLLVVPKVVMSIVSFWIWFNCSLFLKSCVINVFCDPVSMRMRAWCHVVEPLAVMMAVCSSTFVWVVAIVARVVDVGQMSLLFCVEFSCFSVGFLFESWLGWCGSQIEVWCFNLQLRHLPLEWHWYLCDLSGGNWNISFVDLVSFSSVLLFSLYHSCCGNVYCHSICMVLNPVIHRCWEVFVE